MALLHTLILKLFGGFCQIFYILRICNMLFWLLMRSSKYVSITLISNIIYFYEPFDSNKIFMRDPKDLFAVIKL